MGLAAHFGSHMHRGAPDNDLTVRIPAGKAMDKRIGINNCSIQGEQMMTRRKVAIITAVIGVVGLITVWVLVNSSSGRLVHSHVAWTRAGIQSVMYAIEVYKQDCGSFPSEKDGLQALLKDPGVAGWQGPYIRDARMPTDDWGIPFRYSLVSGSGSNATVSPMITSAGFDHKFGTKDDMRGP
jgi:general secretion pathway protein G